MESDDQQSLDAFDEPESESESNPPTPPELCEAYLSLDNLDNTIPEKSKEIYESSYNRFLTWRETKNTTSFSKRVLLAYFLDLSKKYQPSTLYSEYSKLKGTLKIKEDVDIGDYTELKQFLRTQASGFVAKKGKVLSESEIKRFLNEAPDKLYLAVKVATIFRSFGECKREELKNITIDDIKKYYNYDDKERKKPMIRVQIRNSNPEKQRDFTLEGEFYNFYEKYRQCRFQKSNNSKEFFLNYRDGKCTRQPIGINKFGRMPKEIAQFLGLPNPEEYTGHSKSSAKLHSEEGLVTTTLPTELIECDDEDNSNTTNDTPKQYVAPSPASFKRKLCNQITSSINLKKPAFDKNTNSEPPQKPPEKDQQTSATKTYVFAGQQNPDTAVDITSPGGTFTLRISNCSNCTFNFIEKKAD